MYLRVYLPEQIMKERSELAGTHSRDIGFGTRARTLLTKEQVLQSIVVADTWDGDEIIWFEGRYYVLPREEEKIYEFGRNAGRGDYLAV